MVIYLSYFQGYEPALGGASNLIGREEYRDVQIAKLIHRVPGGTQKNGGNGAMFAAFAKQTAFLNALNVRQIAH